MLYGYEVTHATNSEMNELEQAHRYHAKVVQGVPQNVPTPAPLAPLGWQSIKSYIAIQKLTFLWRILSFKCNNLYKVIITSLFFMYVQNQELGQSAVKQAFDLAKKYGMYDTFVAAIFNNEIDNYDAVKRKIKTRVKSLNHEEWYASCMMYPCLSDIYLSVQTETAMNVWYKCCNSMPNLTKQVSNIMAIIMGCQPKGMQHNIDGLTCLLCNTGERDTPCHVLLVCKCPTLRNARDVYWKAITDEMPLAMRNSVEQYASPQRSKFILSCMGGAYIQEWNGIYRHIALFVTKLYQERDALYRAMQS